MSDEIKEYSLYIQGDVKDFNVLLKLNNEARVDLSLKERCLKLSIVKLGMFKHFCEKGIAEHFMKTGVTSEQLAAQDLIRCNF